MHHFQSQPQVRAKGRHAKAAVSNCKKAQGAAQSVAPEVAQNGAQHFAPRASHKKEGAQHVAPEVSQKGARNVAPEVAQGLLRFPRTEKHHEHVLKLKESSGEAVVRLETCSRVARSGHSLPPAGNCNKASCTNGPALCPNRPGLDFQVVVLE